MKMSDISVDFNNSNKEYSDVWNAIKFNAERCFHKSLTVFTIRFFYWIFLCIDSSLYRYIAGLVYSIEFFEFFTILLLGMVIGNGLGIRAQNSLWDIF